MELRDSKEECPKCGKQLQGAPIPEKDQWMFGATHFSKVIGIYDRDKDRTSEWMCPFCRHRWPAG